MLTTMRVSSCSNGAYNTDAARWLQEKIHAVAFKCLISNQIDELAPTLGKREWLYFIHNTAISRYFHKVLA